MQWFPLKGCKFVGGGCVGGLSDHIPVAVESCVAIDIRVTEEFVDSPDDSFVPIGDGDVECLACLVGCGLPKLAYEVDAGEKAPSVRSRAFWWTVTWAAPGG